MLLRATNRRRKVTNTNNNIFLIITILLLLIITVKFWPYLYRLTVKLQNGFGQLQLYQNNNIWVPLTQFPNSRTNPKSIK